MEADEIHRTALVHYKKITDKIREIVGHKIFDQIILGNQSDNSNYAQTTQEGGTVKEIKEIV